MKAEIVRVDKEHPDKEILKKAGSIIKRGGLVAFPTETVYGLGGDALDPEASNKIYSAKGRPSDNPLIIHIARLEDIDVIAKDVPEKAMILAKKCWPGPLTMIFNKTDKVPKETTGGLDTVAVRFPSHEVARELILDSGGFIAAPSANLSGRPSPTTAQHVIEDLSDRIDMIIDSGEAQIGLESTIVDFTSDTPVILRPGFYSREDIMNVLGEVEVDKALISSDSGIKPRAPGMKYRHYAPKGDLTIVEGDAEKVIEKINSLAKESAQEGKRTAVLCSDETKDRYENVEVISLGSLSNEEEIAHRLFAVLRQLDDESIEYIYSEAFKTRNIGDAIMNRLLKAAGHKVIKV